MLLVFAEPLYSGNVIFTPFLLLAISSATADQICPLPNEADPAILANIVRYTVPPLDCVKLKRKIDFWNPDSGSDNPEFSFLRSVVPWYWDFLRRDQICASQGNKGILSAETHQAMNDFKGFCAGDAHPENFAIQYYPDSAPTFGINDPDDAG